jgi:hypothetical protein
VAASAWHRGRVPISEVFRFENLGFELVAEDFYKVLFHELEIGEFDVEALRLRSMRGCEDFLLQVVMTD